MTQTSTGGAERTIGLDLGDRWSEYVALDADGQRVGAGRVRSTAEGFAQLSAQHAGAFVVMETGTHSPWAARQFEEAGHPVVVANSSELALVTSNVRKSDRRDAEILARLGRADAELLHPVAQRQPETQQRLAKLRARRSMVRARAEMINSVRGTAKSLGTRTASCSTDSFHVRALAGTSPELRDAVKFEIASIAALTAQILLAEAELEAIAASMPAVAAMRQVPGVGLLIALTFALTIEDPARFARRRDAAAYFGLAPGRRQSGERDPKMGITKRGNAEARSLLVQGAHYILGAHGPDCALRRWGLELERTKGKRKAIVATARKLAVLMLALWATGEVYDPMRGARPAAAEA